MLKFLLAYALQLGFQFSPSNILEHGAVPRGQAMMMVALLLAAPAEWRCPLTLKNHSTFIWKYCRGLDNYQSCSPMARIRLMSQI